MGIWNDFETKWTHKKRSGVNTEDTTKEHEKEKKPVHTGT